MKLSHKKISILILSLILMSTQTQGMHPSAQPIGRAIKPVSSSLNPAPQAVANPAQGYISSLRVLAGKTAAQNISNLGTFALNNDRRFLAAAQILNNLTNPSSCPHLPESLDPASILSDQLRVQVKALAEKSGYDSCKSLIDSSSEESFDSILFDDCAHSLTNDQYNHLLMHCCVRGKTKAFTHITRSGKVNINYQDRVNYCTTPLIAASANNHPQIVRLLLAAGAEIDKATSDGFTPLYLASNGRLEIVELLLAAGADINKATKNGTTPLHMAASRGHLQIAELLLAAGAHLNTAAIDEHTPLFIAAHQQYTQIVELLLAAGADTNKAIKNGVTPLFNAAQQGLLQIVELLLAAGAHVDQATIDGHTPLFIAAQKGHLQIVELLLAAGADINKATIDGPTPLFIAAQKGHLQIAKRLLTAGADINIATKNGVAPLFVATQNGHSQMVELLLAAGAHVDQATIDGHTPLFMAAQQGHLQIAKRLLTAGADINIAEKNGVAPLFITTQNGHSQMVELLLAAGADVNTAKKGGATSLFIAASKGHSWIVELLLAAGAHVDQATIDGHTPLLIAIQNGYSHIVELLIAARADINKADNNGVTLLLIAASKGNSRIVERLLAAGADETKTCQGRTALMLAQQKGYGAIVDLINNYDPFHCYTSGNFSRLMSLLSEHPCKGTTFLRFQLNNNQFALVELLLKNMTPTHEQLDILSQRLFLEIDAGSFELVKKIIKAGAPIDTVNAQGYTPLMRAIKKNDKSMVQHLLDAGADLNITRNGQRAFGMSNGKPEIRALIEKRMNQKSKRKIDNDPSLGDAKRTKEDTSDAQSNMSTSSASSSGSASSLSSVAAMTSSSGISYSDTNTLLTLHNLENN